MKLLPTGRKRRLITALVVVVALALFTWQWAAAPRVKVDPAVTAKLREAPPNALFLGDTFEGLPLRTVDPFLYSDCKPGVPKTSPTPCHWIRVQGGVVTGSSASQVTRARAKLRPVGSGTP